VVVIAEKDFETGQHVLVPKHTKLGEKEKESLLAKYQVTLKDFPKISMKDPAVAHMELTTKDIIKIERPSPTAKSTIFYRKVGK
jgi:DNA-directed RNA polymerase subunit H (RpoH/RPB5)